MKKTIAKKEKISVFWFRRDLRLEDNHGLSEALKSPFPVLPLFIFDTEITGELPENDPRITFIYDLLSEISDSLKQHSSYIYCKKGQAEIVWKQLLNEFDIQEVYTNEDYEPYAIRRDKNIKKLLSTKGIPFLVFKDQVIFAKDEVLKNDNTPYTVFTPYRNRWMSVLDNTSIASYTSNGKGNFARIRSGFPKLQDLGFERSTLKVRPYSIDDLDNYSETRNFPALDSTSRLGPHLRFGSISIRKVVSETITNQTFLNELIWREFFMQILYHFPGVVTNNFRSKYDGIAWRDDPAGYDRWKKGETGYLMVDAGMRELNETGYMHNRVRMVVAGFLCKHLLIHWRWGEAYFAEKLLDYELSSNNGNWQWAAGTGCDAAPYFRVFNPIEQAKKFDPDLKYIKKWIPGPELSNYYEPIVEHKFARERAINTYKEGMI